MGRTVKEFISSISKGNPIDVKANWKSSPSHVAALLFMVMPIDGEIKPEEQERLARILQDEFSIDEMESRQLVEKGRILAKDTENLAHLTETVRTSMSKKEQLQLISHMWEMVFADGKVHEFECLLVERVGELIGVSRPEIEKLMNAENH
jgi:uncharacterized tellurite resistance protein B-like protein